MDHAQYPGMPRWVKIGGIVHLAVVILTVLAAILFGGEHGPGRHAP